MNLELWEDGTVFQIFSFSPSSGSGVEKLGSLKSRSDKPDSTGGLDLSFSGGCHCR